MPTCSTPNLQPRNTHSACSFTSDVFQIYVPTRPLSAPTCQTSRRQNKCAKRSTGEDKVHEAQYEPWHWNWKCRQELSNDPSPTYESIQAVHSLRFHYDLLVITLQDSDSFPQCKVFVCSKKSPISHSVVLNFFDCRKAFSNQTLWELSINSNWKICVHVYRQEPR